MILFSPVSTTTPPLPTALNPPATISAVIRPGRQDRGVRHLAAGQVGDRLLRLPAVANAWVAPSSIAFSRLFSSGSTATTFFAPA